MTRDGLHRDHIFILTLLVPIIIFAVWNSRRHRRRIEAQLLDKARNKVLKDMQAACRQRVERFKLDVERFVNSYLANATTQIVSALEEQLSTTFAEREVSIVGDLARAQVESDRIADRIAVAKQVRNNLVNQLRVELRRHLAQTAKATNS